MSAAAPSRIDDTDPADGWERALLDKQLERLDQLADMGMDIAGTIHRQVTDPEAAVASEALAKGAMDFARVSRAVRMTLALQSKLVRDFKTPIKAGSAGADNDDDDVHWQVQWIDEDCSRKVRDSVRRVAEDSGLDAETVERMGAEAYERVERDDVYPDVMTRSFDEIVAAICRDLGLRSPGATSPVHGGSDQSHAIDQDGPRSGGEGIQTQDGFDGGAEALEMRHALSTIFDGPVRPSLSATALAPPAGEVASP